MGKETQVGVLTWISTRDREFIVEFESWPWIE